jgi:hypothetical protein
MRASHAALAISLAVYAALAGYGTWRILDATGTKQAGAKAAAARTLAASKAKIVHAKLDLPANRLILASDLDDAGPAAKPLVGRYVAAAIRKGEAVNTGATRAAPNVDVPPSGVLVGVRVRRDLVTSGAINAESAASACASGRQVAPVVVAAVLCGEATAAVCTALVPVRSLALAEEPKLVVPGVEVSAACDVK